MEKGLESPSAGTHGNEGDPMTTLACTRTAMPLANAIKLEYTGHHK